MKTVTCVLLPLLVAGALHFHRPLGAASSDGFYQLSEVGPAWDGTRADRLAAASKDYDYTYGDESSVAFTLPWPFTFFGQSYDRIHADTNGNIWFAASGSANSFNLNATQRGPVISAWNDDLSSHYFGGVFVEHKKDPERVVVEWVVESYREEAYFFLNNFEAVLFPAGTVRVDYRSFATETGRDGGSGISTGTLALSLTAAYGDVFTLAGRSFQFAAAPRRTSSR